MNYYPLGNTSLQVSELCFGTLVMSPLQANLPIQEGQALLEYAIDRGINFFDTAELYESYDYFKSLSSSKKHAIVISSKSYAVDEEEMTEAIEDSLRKLGRDYIDIFKLHEQESLLTLKGHRGALRAMQKAKEQGKVRAIGVSTHSVKLVEQLALHPEFEVLHPLFNFKGHGYMHGSMEEQEENLKKLYYAGRGIYVMKPFGGGRFSMDFQNAFAYVQQFPYKHAIAIGMKNRAEVEVNCALIENTFHQDMIPSLRLQEKKLFYRRALCAGCLTCVDACPSKIIHASEDGGITIDHDQCTLCGYCLSKCPHLALRLL
jgi:aryl-alcohol dehydrogenase-like predicted oxidoreductase